MPDYPYRVLHDPPHRSDRVTVRPWEHDVAAFNVVLGLLLVVESTPAVHLLAIYALPGFVYLAAGLLLLCGGVHVLAGLQWPRSRISVGWAIERFGWFAAAAGWFGVGGVVLVVDPFMPVGFLFALFMVAGSLMRLRLLGHVEDEARGKRRRKAVGA